MKALKNHEVNFYLKYIEDPVKKARNRAMVLYSIPVIAVAAGIASVIIGFAAQTAEVKEKIKLCDAILSDAEMLEKSIVADLNSNNSSILSDEIDAVNAFKLVKSSYPATGSEEFALIFDCVDDGMEVTSMECISSDGHITFTLTSDSPVDIPDYIRRLKATGIFETVDYVGYSGGEGENGYSFTAEMVRAKVVSDDELLEYVSDDYEE